MGADGNGHNADMVARADLVDELVLRYDRMNGQLDVTGHVANDEIALSILQQACRTFETRLRVAAARAVQAQAIGDARVQDILQRSRAGRQ